MRFPDRGTESATGERGHFPALNQRNYRLHRAAKSKVDILSLAYHLRGESMSRWLAEDEGQGLVEYALIISVISIAVIGSMVFLRGQLINIFSNIGNQLT